MQNTRKMANLPCLTFKRPWPISNGLEIAWRDQRYYMVNDVRKNACFKYQTQTLGKKT